MTARQLNVNDLAARRVLVIAPHPDDETLGCGGLIWHLVKLGRQVHVVFVTDGGASHLKSPTWSRQRLAAQREQEAARALQRLGAGREARTFMRLHDAAMPAPHTPGHDRARETAELIVDQFQPDLTVLPWRRDPHCDHRDSWRLFQPLLKNRLPQSEVWEYAIWLDELGTSEDKPRNDEMECLSLHIREALDAKLHAVHAHHTQLGSLITDDPSGFALTKTTINRLVCPVETYWRQRS